MADCSSHCHYVFFICLLVQMHFISAVSLLLMFLHTLPANAGKCPKACSCDGTKLTVACVGKNLTEVPRTIDEVSSSNLRSLFLSMQVLQYMGNAERERCMF